MFMLFGILPGNVFLRCLVDKQIQVMLINKSKCLSSLITVCAYILLYILFSFKCNTSFD